MSADRALAYGAVQKRVEVLGPHACFPVPPCDVDYICRVPRGERQTSSEPGMIGRMAQASLIPHCSCFKLQPRGSSFPEETELSADWVSFFRRSLLQLRNNFKTARELGGLDKVLALAGDGDYLGASKGFPARQPSSLTGDEVSRLSWLLSRNERAGIGFKIYSGTKANDCNSFVTAKP